MADIGHNADDFDIGLGVRASSAANVGTEGIALSEVAFCKVFVNNRHALAALVLLQRIVLVKIPARNHSGPESRKKSGSDRIQMDHAIRGNALIRLNCHEVIPAATGE